ncbi:MAG TPA: adenylate/guanylate cyclase domain-containing protein [Bradyrhizobium sp.]|nr:adenylate/guanylate cyclase domain-containing protein [Bradyrhizobium sp.]
MTVLTLFLIATFLVGAGVTVAHYEQERKTAINAATDAFAAKIEQINERRLAFFAPAFLMTEQLGSDPTFHQATGSKEAILPLVLASLALNPQISAVYAGFDNGDFFHVLSISEAERSFIAGLGGPQATRFAIREIGSDDNGVRVETWRFLDAKRQQIGKLGNSRAVYDPRTRTWYRDAQAKPHSIVRAAPYIFAATSQPGITLAKAFEGGVVGVDITLDRLMAYIRSVRSNEAHRFLAFDDENRLLGHFDPDQMFKWSGPGGTPEVATTADVTDPVLREALQIFRRQGPFQLAEIEVAGTEYLATIVRQVARDGGVFFVVYAAPLSDFLGSLAGAAARTIPVALVIFALALPAIILLARSISKPLEKLSSEAEMIRSFRLDDPIKMDSRVREINTLIRSMAGMKSTIREVSKFVPKALVRDILESESSVTVGGATRRVSILFTDVKDFTRLAEGMPAENLMVNLSEYFDELASLIINENGTVDKFIGDAIFAFWNAPLPVPRHEHAACVAALKCRAASRGLNERWMKKGLPPWHTRLGIHVGEAVLGNVGASDRIDYTAIGDTVNIAARLEALNKYYGTGILASGQIVDVCSTEFLFRRIDRSQPKGAGKPLDVYELLGIMSGPEEYEVAPEMTKLVKDWKDVYEVYASQDWLRTLGALEAFASEHPEDVVAGIYLNRVVGFLLEPPPDDWDGIIHFSRK